MLAKDLQLGQWFTLDGCEWFAEAVHDDGSVTGAAPDVQKTDLRCWMPRSTIVAGRGSLVPTG